MVELKMTKTKKAKIRQSVKTIKVLDNLIVHNLAKNPYKIFCELVSKKIPIAGIKSEGKTQLIEVIVIDSIYYFFEDFQEVSLLSNGQQLSVRTVNVSNVDIERRAWQYLLNELLISEPLNLELLHDFKKNIPQHVQEYLFGGSFTIQHILDIREMPRYKYDYRLKKLGSSKTHQLPFFSDLIQEVRNDSR